ncbi:MAG: hypothetical protein F4103_04435 [Boseongicola sp. SB0673_bin_14]|nr:hypothetical protein [Boseongicola sp. SB0673_bin_14]
MISSAWITTGLLAWVAFFLLGCGDSPSAPDADLPDDPRFAFEWEGSTQIDSTYILAALADVQDSVNTWFRPALADTVVVQVSVADLNGDYGHDPGYAAMVEGGKGRALNNYRRDLLAGVIAEGGEGYLDFSGDVPVIVGAEIIIDERQLAAERDRIVWKWVLLHEMIHVMGFGTSRQFDELTVRDSTGTPVINLGHALDDPYTGHWRQTGSGRLLEPYFPGADEAFVSRETLQVLEKMGWTRR